MLDYFRLFICYRHYFNWNKCWVLKLQLKYQTGRDWCWNWKGAEAGLHPQKVAFHVVAIFKIFPHFDIFARWKRLPSHPSGLAKRSQAVCGQQGGVQIIAPLVSRQHVCKHLWMPNPHKCMLKFAQMFLFVWAQRFVFDHKCPNWLQLLLLRAAVEEAGRLWCEWEEVRMSRKQKGTKKSPSPIVQTVCLTESCVPVFLMCSKHRQKRVAVVQPLDRLTFPSLQPLSLQQAVPQKGLFRIAARSK